ncbi:MAG: enoyl-CoA hydratase/isomerase family protein [Mycobacterium sp.]|nr:enoyl-CoA hydratase/isomerase family protein [Mycobacterium sp.]
MSVSYQREESIAMITMDDGKVNALGPDMLAAINAALDRAEGEEAGAVVIAGNDRVFSGGFDLKVFKSGDVQASIGMLKAGFELSHRLLSFPRPVVAACTGHAIAMGSFLACSADPGGWVDELVMGDMVLDRAREAAHEFATTLHAKAHHACKMRARQETLDAMRAGIDNIHTEFGL